MQSVYFVVVMAALLCSTGRAEKGGCQTDNECKDHEACFPSEGVCGDLWINCQSPNACPKNESCTIRNHKVVCLRNQKGCRRHNNCPENELCLLNLCVNPCEAMECGANSECTSVNRYHITCQCKAGFHRVDPSNTTSACTECSSHSHCPGSNMCVLEKCIDLCQHNVCGDNSTCNIEHNKLSCNGIEVQARVNTTDFVSKEQQCRSHTDCADTEMCMFHKCGDPCEHTVCGNNSACVTTHHSNTTCPCLPGYQRVDPGNVTSACGTLAELSVDVRHKDGARWDGGWVREASLSLQTRDVEVELTRLWYTVQPAVDYTLNTTIVSPSENVTLTHSVQASPINWSNIPVSTEERPVVLRPHTLYNITILSDKEFWLFTLPSPRYTEPHFHLQFPPHDGGYSSPVAYIVYKAWTVS